MLGSSYLSARKILVLGRWYFLLFLGLKTIKNCSRQIRQLYACVANKSTLRLRRESARFTYQEDGNKPRRNCLVFRSDLVYGS